MSSTACPRAGLVRDVTDVVERIPALDIHTHLYDPALSALLLWGVDELLTYHYLVAEAARHLPGSSEPFLAWPKARQAEWIWDQLFLRHSPISEACRGVLTSLHGLGLDPRRRDLGALRRWFAGRDPETHVHDCLDRARVRVVCMTNSPFDDAERPYWERGFDRDNRFLAALRVDPLLLDWPRVTRRLVRWGYRVTPRLSTSTLEGIRRFVVDWVERMGARYVMVSLPPEFRFPGPGLAAQVLERALLPACRDTGRPLALMLGVRRGVNPALGLAGDGVGRSDLGSLAALCAGFPRNRFLATVLARENQHELCVLARKFPNLHPFGCWWFVNVPVLVDEITQMRLELVGWTQTPQHSDARVVEQLISKWAHFRQILAQVLAGHYAAVERAGWSVPRDDIERDVRGLLGGAFESFCTAATGPPTHVGGHPAPVAARVRGRMPS